MQQPDVGGIGRAHDLDTLPRTPKDVSAAEPFLVPQRTDRRLAPTAPVRTPGLGGGGKALRREELTPLFLGAERAGYALRCPLKAGGPSIASNGLAVVTEEEAAMVGLMPPNVKLTGRRRMDALPARRRISTVRLAGKVASRWRSG